MISGRVQADRRHGGRRARESGGRLVAARRGGGRGACKARPRLWQAGQRRQHERCAERPTRRAGARLQAATTTRRGASVARGRSTARGGVARALWHRGGRSNPLTRGAAGPAMERPGGRVSGGAAGGTIFRTWAMPMWLLGAEHAPARSRSPVPGASPRFLLTAGRARSGEPSVTFVDRQVVLGARATRARPSPALREAWARTCGGLALGCHACVGRQRDVWRGASGRVSRARPGGTPNYRRAAPSTGSVSRAHASSTRSIRRPSHGTVVSPPLCIHRRRSVSKVLTRRDTRGKAIQA